MSDHHDDNISTGRTSRPADSVAGASKTPRAFESVTVKLGHAVGHQLDRAVRNRHRRGLRRVGWQRALDASELDFAHGTYPARAGNTLDVLVDGSEVLPAVAAELARAQSYVHIAGWFFSPELALSREEEPVVVRNLLAELAERIDVRVLSWKGAPLPAFKPSRRDVREMMDGLARHTQIRAEADACTGLMHCHHEKAIVIDGRVAFVGGIDLTLDGGDPYDTPTHLARGGLGWHDAAVRIEGPAVADIEHHFRLRWHAVTRESLPGTQGSAPVGDTEAQIGAGSRAGRGLHSGPVSLSRGGCCARSRWPSRSGSRRRSVAPTARWPGSSRYSSGPSSPRSRSFTASPSPRSWRP